VEKYRNPLVAGESIYTHMQKKREKLLYILTIVTF